MEKLLERKGIKIFCKYINPIILGVDLPLVITWWGEISWKLVISFTSGLALLLLYSYTTYKYMDKEENQDKQVEKLEKEKNKLEHEVSSLDRGMRELATLFYDSANGLNLIAKSTLNGSINLDMWNFKKVSTGICNSVYNLLCDLCSPNDDFTVNIMFADPSVTGKKRHITMIAHKGKYEKYPGKFQEKLYFSRNSSFYAVKVCRSNNTDIRILTTKEEVNERFVYVDEEHPEYNQYIGIPIVCSGNKIICLLQICAFGNNKIADTKTEIIKIVKKYIFPFTHYALLTYKMEKSLVSSFSVVGKKRGERKYENQINSK